MMGLVFRLFPRTWRARYGDEFLALLDDQAPGRHRWLDLIRCLVAAHLDRATVPSGDHGRGRRIAMSFMAVGTVAIALVVAFAAAASPSAVRKALSLLPLVAVLVPAAALFVLVRLMTQGANRRVRDAVPRALGDLAVITVLGIVFASTLTPGLGLFELSSTIELRPFQEVLAAPTDAVRNEAIAVLAGNAALFTVLGWVLAMRYAGVGLRRVALSLLTIAIGLEIGQIILGTGRPVDISEVIVRVAGGVAGYALWRIAIRRGPTKPPDLHVTHHTD